MKRSRKLQYIAFVLAASVLSGCTLGQAKKAPESSYTVGVIDTAGYGYGTTYLYLYDENLKETDTLKCPYHAVGNYGGTPVQTFDDVLYQLAVGNNDKFKICAIVSMDLQTGEWKNYPPVREGTLQDFRVSENGIFTLRNSGDVSYVDYYPFPDRECITVQVENAAG